MSTQFGPKWILAIRLSMLLLGIATLTAEMSAQRLKCSSSSMTTPAEQIKGKEEKGWLLRTESDKKENKIETWCVDVKGGEFGYLWTAKGAKPEDAVWMGACVFPKGENKWSKPVQDTGGGPKKDKPTGTPDDFTTRSINWINHEPSVGEVKIKCAKVDEEDFTYNDWDFFYNAMTNKLTVEKTKGAYCKKTVKGKVSNTYMHTTVGKDTYSGPTKFSDVKYMKTQLTYLQGADGTATESFVLSLKSVSNGFWYYTLEAGSSAGSGTPEDPFEGTEISIAAGDTFTIAAPCTNAPFVSGPSIEPPYGGWEVSDNTGDAVTFRATYDAQYSPGALIGVFGFYSNNLPAQSVPWDFASSTEYSGSSGAVLAPAPCQ